MPDFLLSRRGLLTAAAALPFAGLPLAVGHSARADIFPAESLVLENGLTVVVTTNRRVPLVTQLLLYRVGAADELPGKSGVAHFLEHLMFKGTRRHPTGVYSDAVAAVGGQENAFTGQDYTGYWQTVPKRSIETVMAFEADRMLNLTLDEAEVLPEREVILEERRSRIDNRPSAQLRAAQLASLFRNHPYGIPIIGWEREMRGLTAEDALGFYDSWYGPQNAILILGGDLDLSEALPIVERTYGGLARRGRDSRRARPREPVSLTARRTELTSPLAAEPQFSRVYLVPHRSELGPGDPEALQLLSMLLGGGNTSRLYRDLVLGRSLALAAGSYDRGEVLDYPTLSLYARPVPGVEIAVLEREIDAQIARFLEEGADATALDEAKDRLQAAAVLVRDDPKTAPRVIGTAMAVGDSLATIQSWPERVAAVTPEQVNALAHRVLQPRRSVTGILHPERPAL
ncbi:MAG: insulinase family protein [Rhodospirillales bacterium]|nr:insulinase family protein [Rhodospirillales bacterium]